MPLSAISCRQAGPGDNTPRIMNDWGQKPCRDRPANTPSSCNRIRATKKVTGGVWSWDVKFPWRHVNNDRF